MVTKDWAQAYREARFREVTNPGAEARVVELPGGLYRVAWVRLPSGRHIDGASDRMSRAAPRRGL